MAHLLRQRSLRMFGTKVHLALLVVASALFIVCMNTPGSYTSPRATFIETIADTNLTDPASLFISDLLWNISAASRTVSRAGFSLNRSSIADYDSIFYKVNMRDELDNCVVGTPFDSLPGYKNPCWISKIDSDSVYNRNARSPWKFHKQLGQVYDERMRKDGFRWRMRCFPYFMLIGVSKCGTTDLFARIRMHPEIFGPTVKEVRFWNRQRIGRLRLSATPDAKLTFTEFLDCFDRAADNIRNYKNMIDGKIVHPGITLEATPHYLWDYEGWEEVPGNHGLLEPRFILAHSLHQIRPDLKFLLIFRNPVSRLYSQFHMLSRGNPSPRQFHVLVQKSIELWNACLTWNTVRGCAYNATLIPYEYTHPGGMTLRAGLYATFLEDWLKLFPREQFHVIKSETYYNDIPSTLRGVFSFLGVRPLNEHKLSSFEEGDVKNSYKKKNHSEPMFSQTRKILDAFYRPFNVRLSELLEDDQFLWE